MKNKIWKKGLLVILSIIILMVGIKTGKIMSVENQKNERRNQATKVLQEEVTKYIIENYEGITKIEWLGWRLNPMGTETFMVVNDYPVGQYIADYFIYTVSEELNLEKLIQYTDGTFAIVGSEQNNQMQYTLHNNGVKKSEVGSPDAIIVYNWEDNKGKW